MCERSRTGCVRLRPFVHPGDRKGGWWVDQASKAEWV